MFTRFRGLVFGTAVALAAGCGSVTDGESSGADAGSADAATASDLVIVTDELPDGNREIVYEVALEARGGTPPYIWSASDLPPGLSASSDGFITGTPSASDSFAVTLTVTDDVGETETSSLPLEISNEPVLTTEALPTLHVLRQYDVDLEVKGGTPPYRFSATGLPAGLAIDADIGTIANDSDNPAITDTTATTVAITVIDDLGSSDVVSLDLETVGVDAITTGAGHTCALDTEGRAFCWGRNSSGQLGNNDAGNDSPLPVAVAGDHVFSDITAGSFHTCAIDEDGAAWCWGDNGQGQLGSENPENDGAVPSEVSGGLSFSVIATGKHHSCAIDEGNNAWCWGYNLDGRLGTTTEELNVYSPVEVEGDHAFTAISGGSRHTCAIDDEQNAWCWGNNSQGALGNDDPGNDSTNPVLVQGGHAFSSITAGTFFNCALDGNDTAWCWGRNSDGQLGLGDEDNRHTPEDLAEGSHTFVSIKAGNIHACAVDDDGTVWCWGANFDGRIGEDYEEVGESSEPVDVESDREFATAAADEHTCAVDERSIAWCWGANSDGRLGNEAPISYLPLPVFPGP